MKHHSGGNHHGHTRPDEKMSPQRRRRVGPGRMNRTGEVIPSPSSAQRQTVQDRANAKRRQRDRMLAWSI